MNKENEKYKKLLKNIGFQASELLAEYDEAGNFIGGEERAISNILDFLYELVGIEEDIYKEEIINEKKEKQKKNIKEMV